MRKRAPTTKRCCMPPRKWNQRAPSSRAVVAARTCRRGCAARAPNTTARLASTRAARDRHLPALSAAIGTQLAQSRPSDAAGNASRSPTVCSSRVASRSAVRGPTPGKPSSGDAERRRPFDGRFLTTGGGAGLVTGFSSASTAQ